MIPASGRNLQLLLVGRYCSLVGDEVLPLALAFGVISTASGTAAEVGFVLGAGVVPLLLVMPVGGLLSDRYNRKWLVIGADSVRAVLLVGAGSYVLASGASVAVFVALQLVAGAAEAIYRPAAGGLVPQVIEREGLRRANVLLGMGTNLGEILGPLLAAALVVTGGVGWALILDGITFAASAAATSGLSYVGHRSSSVAKTISQDRVQGLATLRDQRWLARLLGVDAIWLLFGTAPILVLGPVVAEQLGGAAQWAWVMAAYGVGGLVGGAVALRRSLLRPLALVGGLFVLEAIAPALLAVEAPVPLIATAAVLGGVTSGFAGAVKPTLIHQRVRDDTLGRITALDSLVTATLLPVGFVLAGIIADQVGPSTVFAGAAVAAVVCGALLIVSPATRRLHFE